MTIFCTRTERCIRLEWERTRNHREKCRCGYSFAQEVAGGLNGRQEEGWQWAGARVKRNIELHCETFIYCVETFSPLKMYAFSVGSDGTRRAFGTTTNTRVCVCTCANIITRSVGDAFLCVYSTIQHYIDYCCDGPTLRIFPKKKHVTINCRAALTQTHKPICTHIRRTHTHTQKIEFPLAIMSRF